MRELQSSHNYALKNVWPGTRSSWRGKLSLKPKPEFVIFGFFLQLLIPLGQKKRTPCLSPLLGSFYNQVFPVSMSVFDDYFSCWAMKHSKFEPIPALGYEEDWISMIRAKVDIFSQYVLKVPKAKGARLQILSSASSTCHFLAGRVWSSWRVFVTSEWCLYKTRPGFGFQENSYG